MAQRVVDENRKAGRRIAVAESCTGGLVAGALTEIPGASSVLERGFVTYSNEAKAELLGVAPDIIDTFGAVSIACAWAMAQGALKHSHADVALAITGVAGPDGGTDLKPVGMVVFGLARRPAPMEDAGADGDSERDASEDIEPETEQYDFTPPERTAIRHQAVMRGLELLLP